MDSYSNFATNKFCYFPRIFQHV